jgi:di/tricarboxylate transporter
MTFEIGLVLGILIVSFALFVTEWIRMDVTALLVLGTLAVTGLVQPHQALSGFSNPAVVTVWAMFMLSAGLTQTGVANVIGRRVLKLAGTGETRIVFVVMITSGVLSAFMNNIGVAALMLPVVMDIARRTGRAPSRLLMPLAFGSLLGGLTTLIGTPPNLLVSEALHENGLKPFELFDFAPVGGVVMLVGTAFVAIVARRWLPERDPGRESTGGGGGDVKDEYALEETTVEVRVPRGSPLVGRTLEQSRLGFATGLNVFAVVRGDQVFTTPGGDFLLQADDRLEVEGHLDRLRELRGWRELVIERSTVELEALVYDDVELVELNIAADCELIGKTLRQTGFRRRFDVIALALQRGDDVHVSHLAEMALREGDRLLVQGRRDHLEALRNTAGFSAVVAEATASLAKQYDLERRLFVVRVPSESVLVGKSLKESRLGDALALAVLGFERENKRWLLPESDERLQAEDRLLVRGRLEDLEVFRGLQDLEIESGSTRGLQALESDEVGLIEVTLAPRSRLVGKTLPQLEFRSRYGLQALAILREGTAHRSNLRDMPLRFGDVLLLFGKRERAKVLAGDTDFIMLTQTLAETMRTNKAPLAALILAVVLTPVLLGWLPIAIAAVGGATLMVLTRCMTMEEAYRSVEWRAIFLIAGMLPLGLAMQQTGAANMIAEGVLQAAGSLGPWGIVVGLYLVTAAATMVIPTAALVVLMAPIVLKASADMGISPHASMMAMAIAASASFTSPISHPANLLVMGPGGYRFKDYVRIGVPLTILVLIVTMLVLPWVWPL